MIKLTYNQGIADGCSKLFKKVYRIYNENPKGFREWLEHEMMFLGITVPISEIEESKDIGQ